jgi:hypothetical protein
MEEVGGPSHGGVTWQGARAGQTNDAEMGWDAPSSSEGRASQLDFPRAMTGDNFPRTTSSQRGSGSFKGFGGSKLMGSSQPLMADLAALIWSRTGISKDNLELGPLVGKGSYGRVYKGVPSSVTFHLHAHTYPSHEDNGVTSCVTFQVHTHTYPSIEELCGCAVRSILQVTCHVGSVLLPGMRLWVWIYLCGSRELAGLSA